VGFPLLERVCNAGGLRREVEVMGSLLTVTLPTAAIVGRDVIIQLGRRLC